MPSIGYPSHVVSSIGQTGHRTVYRFRKPINNRAASNVRNGRDRFMALHAARVTENCFSGKACRQETAELAAPVPSLETWLLHHQPPAERRPLPPTSNNSLHRAACLDLSPLCHPRSPSCAIQAVPSALACSLIQGARPPPLNVTPTIGFLAWPVELTRVRFQ